MAREVGTEKMVSALAESVKPRLSGSQQPLDTFQVCIANDNDASDLKFIRH